jgi:hypothetical protein
MNVCAQVLVMVLVVSGAYEMSKVCCQMRCHVYHGLTRGHFNS